MLNAKDNETVTRVGPGTLGGDLIRRYWIPVLLSSELPERDGAPLRVRLLGEDLLAFRDSNGTVALVDAFCPHRRAPLFFGRNEECGLRCVYHGWKFDAAGNCVDMPSEPPDSLFKSKVKLTAYPCVERGKLVYTYMGPADPPPPFPQLEYTQIPEDRVHIYKLYMEANWVQVLDGAMDPIHAQYLHSGVTAQDQQAYMNRQPGSPVYNLMKGGWDFQTEDTEAGVMLVGRRNIDEQRDFWRITQYLFPVYQMAPTSSGENPALTGTIMVPVDDTHTMFYGVRWHPLRPLTEDDVFRNLIGWNMQFMPLDTARPGSEWLTTLNRHNDYGLDRSTQRSKTFSGIPEIVAQDAAICEGMGPIVDRSGEHLIRLDVGIIAVRRAFIRAARALREHGTLPPGVNAPEAYMRRAPTVLLPPGVTNWVEALRDWYVARPGVNPAMAE